MDWARIISVFLGDKRVGSNPGVTIPEGWWHRGIQQPSKNVETGLPMADVAEVQVKH